MTEQEWLACDDVRGMLGWLPTRPRRRLAIWLGRSCEPGQLRRFCLFAAACFTRIAKAGICPDERGLFTDRLTPRVRIDPEDHPVAPWNEGVCARATVFVEKWAPRWADAASRCVAWQRAYSAGQFDWSKFKRARGIERRVQAALLRCVYGNPFHPAPEVDLDWLESAGRPAERLARSISAADAFERLPELADLLEEAGCSDADLLNHCREPGEHGRGCWALELLAGAVGLHQRARTARASEAILRSLGPIHPEQWPTLDGGSTPHASNSGSSGITMRLPRSR